MSILKVVPNDTFKFGAERVNVILIAKIQIIVSTIVCSMKKQEVADLSFFISSGLDYFENRNAFKANGSCMFSRLFGLI